MRLQATMKVAVRRLTQRVGLYAVVVDAKHVKAKSFYARLGFIACFDNPLCLYLPVSTLEQSIG